MTKGLIIGGSFGSLFLREKNSENIEIGELLKAKTKEGTIIFEVVDLEFGSQLNKQTIEMISGLKLENSQELKIIDSNLRMYNIAKIKPLTLIKKDGTTKNCKILPKILSEISSINEEDIIFRKNENSLYLGNLRSGSKTLNTEVFIDGQQALSHHILISGTTGRGKSVFMMNILWDSIDKEYCGILVLDPHDEYYGRTKTGLKDHPASKEKLTYYTAKDPPIGAYNLKISIELLQPNHFNGVIEWSPPQNQLISAYYKKYGKEWIRAIILEKKIPFNFNEQTIAVVKRILMNLLNISSNEQTLSCSGIFSICAGNTIIEDIINSIIQGKTIIIDTSSISGSTELLIGSIFANSILKVYKKKSYLELQKIPTASIVIEEAPRVLGKEVLERGSNVFASIAREGRKFKTGLIAITQLPSLIPKAILANINTKIILGIELKPERQAIIESAAQDLTENERAITSLDRGEAIATSCFVPFATPLKIPMLAKKEKITIKTDFGELK
jgi:uncharacterized protein